MRNLEPKPSFGVDLIGFLFHPIMLCIYCIILIVVGATSEPLNATLIGIGSGFLGSLLLVGLIALTPKKKY